MFLGVDVSRVTFAKWGLSGTLVCFFLVVFFSAKFKVTSRGGGRRLVNCLIVYVRRSRYEVWDDDTPRDSAEVHVRPLLPYSDSSAFWCSSGAFLPRFWRIAAQPRWHRSRYDKLILTGGLTVN